VSPSPWPNEPSSDRLTEVARQFVLRVREEIGTQSIRSVASRAGMSHATLLNVLAGRAWPDLATIARLEFALDADLYSSATVRRSSEQPDASSAV
jgi:transcriptional regulator with XRE-family HTH domain